MLFIEGLQLWNLQSAIAGKSPEFFASVAHWRRISSSSIFVVEKSFGVSPHSITSFVHELCPKNFSSNFNWTAYPQQASNKKDLLCNMKKDDKYPLYFQEFLAQFSNENSCWHYLIDTRWLEG